MTAETKRVLITQAERSALIRANRKKEAGMREAQALAQKATNEFATVVDSVLDAHGVDFEVAGIDLTSGEIKRKAQISGPPA